MTSSTPDPLDDVRRAGTSREHRLAVGGLELAVRTRADVAAALFAHYEGYEGRGGPPDAVLEYEADDDFRGEQPAERPFPGFAFAARSATEYAFARRDSRGVVTIPAGTDEPVVGRFAGLPIPWALEAPLRILMSLALPRRGGLLLHSSGVVAAGQGLVFPSPSGSGKSTLARLLAGAATRPLGDDLTVVRRDGDRFVAHATPFAGECHHAAAIAAPLAGLYFLAKAPAHRVVPLPRHEAVGRILRNTMTHVGERESAARALAVALDLASSVPTHVLEFARDPDVARALGIAPARP